MDASLSAAEPHRLAMATTGKGAPAADPLRAMQTLLERADHRQGELEQDLRRLKQQLAWARKALRGSRVREQHALHDAHHDALTGLPNRSAFALTTRRALTRHAIRHDTRCTTGQDAGPDAPAQPFGLLFVDLDGFKAVNDHHGHATGDALLQVIGSRLAHAVRADDAVCRHGGDEFVCLLRDAHGDAQVAAVARKLIEVVSTPCRIGGVTLSVRPSVGIALYPRDGLDFDTLLHSADAAMYHAKRLRLGHAFHGATLGVPALPLHAPPPRLCAATSP